MFDKFRKKGDPARAPFFLNLSNILYHANYKKRA